jgi:hypothetical protein
VVFSLGNKNLLQSNGSGQQASLDPKKTKKKDFKLKNMEKKTYSPNNTEFEEN